MKPNYIRNATSFKGMALTVAVVSSLGFSSANARSTDIDGDGIANLVDSDVDGDGIPNGKDRNVDGGICLKGPHKGKFVGDRLSNGDPSELDIDGDSLKDTANSELDIDGDGKSDLTDDDIDGDGSLNDDTADTDIDGDGRPNDDLAETDDDGDEIPDVRDDDDNNNLVKDMDEATHHPESGEEEIEVQLAAQPVAPQDSEVRITLQHYGTGSAKFAVDAQDLAVGAYELLVAGVIRGTIVVVQESERTSGILIFKSSESGSGDLLLDFPVAQQAIELRQADTLYFSGTAPALPPIYSGDEGANSVPLTRGPGISNLAQIEVQFHFDSTNPTQLELNLQKVPVGNYSVVIGNVVRGTLTVLVTAGGNEGELNFEVGGSGSTIPLDFPSAGQPIEILQGSTLYFFGQLPAAAP